MTAKSKSQKPDTSVTDVAEVEVEPRSSVISDETLASISSWEDLQSLFEEGAAQVFDFSDYGTGFEILKNKDSLVGTDFALIGWKFTDGKYSEMVTLFIVTKDGKRWIVNDGGAGLTSQLQSVVKRLPETEKMPVIRVKNGLSKSEYTYVDDNGEEKPAATFYFSY